MYDAKADELVAGPQNLTTLPVSALRCDASAAMMAQATALRATNDSMLADTAGLVWLGHELKSYEGAECRALRALLGETTLGAHPSGVRVPPPNARPSGLAANWTSVVGDHGVGLGDQ